MRWVTDITKVWMVRLRKTAQVRMEMIFAVVGSIGDQKLPSTKTVVVVIEWRLVERIRSLVTWGWHSTEVVFELLFCLDFFIFTA